MDVERQGRHVRVGLLVMLCALHGCAPSTLLAPPSIPVAGDPETQVEEGSLRRVMMLRHNEERRRWGEAPLGWDDALVIEAKKYGDYLASRRVLVHDRSIRGEQGENLWRGTRDAFAYDQMIAAMIDERTRFRPGLFPDVSTTGQWQDVAHYTQMIWPTTTRLGCATTRGIFYDYLVCRYAPAGNITGRPVGGYVPPDPDGT